MSGIFIPDCTQEELAEILMYARSGANNSMIGVHKQYISVEDTELPRWIPVSERTPDDLEPVNITWINHEPEPYYKEIKDKPFTATGVYFNGQWYWWSTLCTDILAEYSFSYDDIIDTAIEVIAWQPLPEPYKEGGAEWTMI